MSLVVLHHSDLLSIATSKRVVCAQEVGSLQSMCEQADNLSARLSVEESRLKEAEDNARQKGYQSGFEAGKQEGLDAVASELELERKELERREGLLESEATSMAFDIVRSLADTLDSAELLCALAISAAKTYDSDDPLELRVHEMHQEAVAVKLARSNSEFGERFVRVVGDSTVDTKACIIESHASRTLADLQTQTDLLESKLGGA